MQVTAALGIGLVLALFLGVVVGLTWFLAVPVGVLIFLIPIGWVAFASRQPRLRGQSGTTTGEASYDAAVDPLDRYRTPQQ